MTRQLTTIYLGAEEKQTLVDALRARLTYLQGIRYRQENYPPTPKRNEKLAAIEAEMLRTERVLYLCMAETDTAPKRQLLKKAYDCPDQCRNGTVALPISDPP